MLEDIGQMNDEVMQNDKQPKNILYYQLNQLYQNIMCLFYIYLNYLFITTVFLIEYSLISNLFFCLRSLMIKIS